jgi:hypothetical protein
VTHHFPGLPPGYARAALDPRLALAAVAAFSLIAQTACGTDPLDSPRDYQVFQRDTITGGKIVVRGRSPKGCDAAEARIAGNWQPLHVDRDCQVDGTLAAPAGGRYTLQVRFRNAGRVTAHTSVAHVGIGEVFVISGQSNSTNFGEALQTTRTRMVSTFDGSRWRIADDPQPGVQDDSNQGSFIPAFGDALYARLKVPVAVACVGFGGTSVRQWLPKGDRFPSPPSIPQFFTAVGVNQWESDGHLFDGMVQRIRQLGPNGFRALLWHQGEADANQSPGHQISGAEYRRMMERLIRSVRAATWDFPWMVAQVSYHSPDDRFSADIRAAQASLWKDGIALEGPDTDTLTGDNRQDGGTGVHMSAKGLQAHGAMWAEKVGQWISQR